MKYDQDYWVISHDGLALPKRLRPVAIDLFAGAGGFSVGLMQAGYEVIAALEWDAMAAITYMYNLGSYPIKIHFGSPDDEERLEKALKNEMNFKDGKIATPKVSGGSGFWEGSGMVPVTHFFFGDIRHFTGEQILAAIGMDRDEVDLVVGGPPCQGFSKAGKQNVMDPRNSLVFEFVRMVLEISPKTMVMENVPEIANMVTPEGLPVVDTLCKILERGNFGGFEALKRSLLTSAGLGAAVKGQKNNPAKKHKNRSKQKQEQMGLL